MPPRDRPSPAPNETQRPHDANDPDNRRDPLARRARSHWSPARLRNLFGGKRLPLHPVTHCALLHATGLMQDNASMKSGEVRKFLQVNHMIRLVAPALAEIAKAMPGHPLHMLDAGCGNSWLSLALAYLAEEAASGRSAAIREWDGVTFRLRVTGVDSEPSVIERARARADRLGLSGALAFHCGALRDAPLPDRLHAVLALHACDTATDDALALGIRRNADVLAVAPCCQAELAQHFRKPGSAPADSPLAVILHSPNLRREACAVFTDALRLALVRALGYEATATEFIESSHTPRNRLILATRRGRYHLPSWREFRSLRDSLGAPPLALEAGLAGAIGERIPVAG